MDTHIEHHADVERNEVYLYILTGSESQDTL